MNTNSFLEMPTWRHRPRSWPRIDDAAGDRRCGSRSHSAPVGAHSTTDLTAAGKALSADPSEADPPIVVYRGRDAPYRAGMMFVYRSPYEGPLGKHVQRLPDETVLAWFQRGWDVQDAEEWAATELGV